MLLALRTLSKNFDTDHNDTINHYRHHTLLMAIYQPTLLGAQAEIINTAFITEGHT